MNSREGVARLCVRDVYAWCSCKLGVRGTGDSGWDGRCGCRDLKPFPVERALETLWIREHSAVELQPQAPKLLIFLHPYSFLGVLILFY